MTASRSVARWADDVVSAASKVSPVSVSTMLFEKPAVDASSWLQPEWLHEQKTADVGHWMSKCGVQKQNIPNQFSWEMFAWDREHTIWGTIRKGMHHMRYHERVNREYGCVWKMKKLSLLLIVMLIWQFKTLIPDTWRHEYLTSKDTNTWRRNTWIPDTFIHEDCVHWCQHVNENMYTSPSVTAVNTI